MTRPFTRTASWLLALSAGAAGPALAATPGDSAPPADGGSAVEQVVVTARHRSEALESVPLAITALPGKDLAVRHLDRLEDYAVKVPNFSALQQNTRVSALNLRGLGGNASNDGAEGGVGLIVDNVVYTHVGFSWLDFVDLESVEVVRGPQGTLLGKNTTIGAIVVQTARPSFTPALNLSASYGEHNAWQIRANATGPLTGTLAYRLTFATSEGGGYVANARDGIPYLDNNRWSARGQLLWSPVSDLTDRLIAEHYESREYNNWYPPVADATTNLDLAGHVFATPANPTGARATSWSAKLFSRFGYTPDFADAPFTANLDTQGALVSRTDGVSNQIDRAFGDVNLTAVSAWRRLYFRPYNDGDYSPLPIDRIGYDVDVDQYSQELRLASAKGRTIEWTVGAYYLHEDVESRLRYIFYSDATAFVVSPALPAALLNGVEYDKDGRLHIDSLAGFGQATVNLAPSFSITAGLRYTDEKKSVHVIGGGFGGAALPGALADYRAATLAGLGGTPAAAAGSYALDAGFDRGSWAWLVNPALRLGSHVLVYGSASYGEKSGAANTAASAAQASVALTLPEKSLDFEGGIKGHWLDDRLIVNLNLFNDTVTNYQAAQIDPANAGIGTYLANVGKVRMRGAEIEASAQVIEGITLNLAGGYNDARYLAYDNAPAPIEYQAYLAATNGISAAATTLSLTGQQVIGAPRWTGQGGLAFDRPAGAHWRVTGYADVSYRSGTNFINPLSVFGNQPGYAIVNAGFGLKQADAGWTLQLWSKNLFNRRYAVGFGAATALTPVIAIYGDPRASGLTVSRRF